MGSKPSRCAGASVLCYSLGPDGKLYLLLAQDADGGKWSDFGGGVLYRNEPESVCARRELAEEAHGIVKVPRLGACPRFDFQFDDFKNRRRHYTTYLAEVPFNGNLQARFQKARRTVRCANLPLKVQKARLEKVRIDYLIPNSQNGNLRSFFKLRLGFLMPYIEQIQGSVQTGTLIPFKGHVKTFPIKSI